VSGNFQPRNEAELSETLRGCTAENRRVRLSGGGLIAKSPPEGTLGVWMFGITGIVEIREGDLVATARAGTSLFELGQELAERGRRFPLRPHDAGDRATVGGVFAAGADGLAGRLGFRARDTLLGARAVLSNGDRVAVGAKVVKSVSGLDVCKALVGSRGCLAAITEATFRIEAIPEASVTLAGIFRGHVEAHAAVAAADALPLSPAALVVSPQEDDLRVDVLLEGPRAAVAEASRRLARTGFAEDPGDWVNLTSHAALEPRTRHVRVVGRAPRAAPLDSVPPGAHSFLVDVLRGRFYAHVAEDQAPPRPADDLRERVRNAFDPSGTFVAGRGLGTP
jgi:glycolate oxidase FAD binding subunit